MNTSGAGQTESMTSLRGAEDAPEPRSRSKQDEELLAAIAAALQGQGATPPTPLAEVEAAGPAERWRQSGGALTGTDAHIDGAAAPSISTAGDSATESRLVARIDTPTMGSVCVVIDRSEAGMKVSLAMDDAAAARSAHAERASLVRALETAGLTVASVSVTQTKDGGITFAQVRDAHDAHLFGASDEGEAADGKPEGRFRRRLNLVG